MARPRMPSNVLELKGAFDHDPQRRRVDPEGAGELDQIPPRWLDKRCVPIWRELVAEFPKIQVTQSDRQALALLAMSMETARRCYGKKGREREYSKSESAVRSWLIQFGMTPAARTRFAVKGKPAGAVNPFTSV